MKKIFLIVILVLLGVFVFSKDNVYATKTTIKNEYLVDSVVEIEKRNLSINREDTIINNKPVIVFSWGKYTTSSRDGSFYPSVDDFKDGSLKYKIKNDLILNYGYDKNSTTLAKNKIDLLKDDILEFSSRNEEESGMHGISNTIYISVQITRNNKPIYVKSITYPIRLDNYNSMTGDIVYDREVFFISLKDIKNKIINNNEVSDISLVTTIEKPYSIDDIKSNILAYDNNKDITSKITLEEDNYTNKKNKNGGVYDMKFSVVDDKNHKSILLIHIYEYDIIPPEITSSVSSVNIAYNKVFDIENFRKNNLFVSDNASTLTNSDIKVDYDGYTKNSKKIGKYEVYFYAQDMANNRGEYKLTINVVDNIKPVISTNKMYYSYNVGDIAPTVDSIKRTLNAFDEIDGNITSNIEISYDNYSSNKKVFGKHNIKFIVKDKSNNETSIIITVEVLGNNFPKFYVTNMFIETEKLKNMTKEDIKKYLQKTNQLNK